MKTRVRSELMWWEMRLGVVEWLDKCPLGRPIDGCCEERSRLAGTSRMSKSVRC